MKFKLSNVLGNYLLYLKNKKEAHLLRPEEAKTLRSQMLPDDIIPNCEFYLSKIHEDIMANKDLLDMFDYTESEKQKIKDTLFANELTDEQFNELLGYLIKENKENFNTERISLQSIFMDNVMKDENTWTEIIHLDEEDFNESLAGLDKVYKVNFKTYDSEPSGFTVEVSGPKENVKHFIVTEHDSNYDFEEEEIDDLGDWITEGKNETQDLFIQLCLPSIDISTNLSIDASQLRSLIQQLSDNSGDFTHIEYYRDFAFTDVTAVNFIDNLNALELIIRLDEKAIKFENCDYAEFETILSTFLDVEGMEENYLDNSNFKEDNSFHDDDEETDYEAGPENYNKMVEIEHNQYANLVNQRIHEVEVRKNPYKIWHGYNGGKGLVDEFDEDYNTCMIFEFITGTNKFKIHEFEKPQEEGITDIEWSPSEFSYVDGTFYELDGYTDERADFNNNGWRITEELKEFLEENIDNMDTKFPVLTEDELSKINNIIGQPLITLEWLNIHLVQIDKIDSDQANDLEFLIERIATHVEDYIDYDLFFDKYNRYEEWVENDYDNTMFFGEDEDEEEVDYDEMDDDEILSSYENFVFWYNNWAANFDSERIDFVNVSEDKFDALLEVTNRINGGLTAVDFAEIIETISNK